MCNIYFNLSCVILIFYFNIAQLMRLDKNNVECGIIPNTKDTQSFIMGGTLAQYMQFPWIVVLMHKVEKRWIQHCGATLISSKYVITAAHCFYTSDGKVIKFNKLKVLLGVGNWKKNEPYKEVRRLKKVTIHEKFDWETKINDITIIKLSRPINFEKTMIRPICLPDKNDSNNLYQGDALSAGWGITDKECPERLKYATLPIANKTACAKELEERGFDKYLFRTTFCTINPDEGKDVCGGDSGGPFMGIRKKTGIVYLRGIVSFGSFVCAGFGAYSKVSYFLDWIHKNTCQKKSKQ